MRTQKGFTLLELIVTLSIVLILSGVSVASYATLNANSQDTAAEQALDRAVFAQRAWLARNATWASDPAVLKPGRGVTITTTASRTPGQVSIAVDTQNRLGLATQSETGTCFARLVGDPLLDGNETRLQLDDTVACSGQSALANN